MIGHSLCHGRLALVRRPRWTLWRWRAGSSSEYIRTSKRLVFDAQNAVAKAIKEYEGTDDVFGEEVVFDGLAAHLKAKGVDEDGVRAQVGRLRSFAPSCIRMVPPEVKEVDVQEGRSRWSRRGSTR